ncbi:hypothetical protein H6F38_20055 [Paenibacillus sp. EKM208P]|nr:hypothetical protein H6F38_20055 [Paenibacillus sp. EKM208P]
MNNQPLYIHRVLLDPPIYHEDTTFREGLNVIWAESTDKGSANSVGKTTLKNLIDYGLGKTEFISEEKHKQIPVLQGRCLVFMFSCYEAQYTLRRMLSKVDHCVVYRNWSTEEQQSNIDFTGDIAGYVAWLENKLWAGRNRPSNDLKISFRQAMSLLARDQITGFSAKEKSFKSERKKVTQDRLTFLLGFITEERIEVREEQERATALVEENKATPQILEKFLSTQEIAEEQIKWELKSLRGQMAEKVSELKIMEAYIKRLQETELSRLTEELIKTRNQYEDIEGNLLITESRINQYAQAQKEAKLEIEELDILVEARQSFKLLNSYKCPHCHKELPEEIINLALHDCGVLNSSDENEFSPDLTAIEERKMVLNFEIEDLMEAIEALSERLEILVSNKKEIGVKLTNLQNKITEIEKQQHNDLKELNSSIFELENQIDVLVKSELLYKRKDELLKQLRAYRKQKREADAKMKAINEKEKEMKATLSSYFHEIISFLYNKQRKGKLDPETLKPEILHIKGEMKDDGAAAITVATIAFDLALLKYSLNFVSSEHLLLLIHDSPAQYEIDLTNIYAKVFDWLIDLENQEIQEHGKIRFQYIITSLYIPENVKDNKHGYIRKKLFGGSDDGKLFGITY